MVSEHTVPAEAAGTRLDSWLTAQLEGVSRSRVQLLLEQESVLVNGAGAKPSLRLEGGEHVAVLREPVLPPLKATPEAIPLDIVYEDADMSVVNKPAGMLVHAGAGARSDRALPPDESGDTDVLPSGENPPDGIRDRGTLVNALLHHYSQEGQLSSGGGDPLRPGIVHRLDRQTSGLILVARNDAAHAKLSAMFAERALRKIYLTLVHGHMEANRGTVSAPIGRDAIRRTRMTTRRVHGARTAISHYMVERRLTTRFGPFTLLRVRIETGRTHQIRVHLSSLGHPVVGDTLYGAPHEIRAEGEQRVMKKSRRRALETVSLGRNFLHAAEIELAHPRTGEPLTFRAPLPAELTGFLAELERDAEDASTVGDE
jgi:23S rRNA pseudouridine1911/1915/1917 synthase